MESIGREKTLKEWVAALECISGEFPGNNISIDVAIRSFKSQLKEIKNRQ